MAISRNDKLSAPLALLFLCLAGVPIAAQENPSAKIQAPHPTPAAQLFEGDRGRAPQDAAARDAVAGARDFDRDEDAARTLLEPEQFGWQNPPQDKDAGQPTSNQRPPLTSGEKMGHAFKTAFLSPVGYATTAVSAAITEATEEDLPHKETEDRIADFGTRWAIRFGTRSTQTLLSSGVYAVLFKQDPRYKPAGKKNTFRRALHAASRVFVTDDDDGNLEPNYSRWAGALSVSALANLWEQSTPGRDRIGTDATFRRFGSSFTSGMVNNIVREFLPDIVGIFRKK